MANLSGRHEKNVPGKFYVTNNCMSDCTCEAIAPSIFRYDADLKKSYVYKQPQTEDELNQCAEAVVSCAIEAIGDDGPSYLSPDLEAAYSRVVAEKHAPREFSFKEFVCGLLSLVRFWK